MCEPTSIMMLAGAAISAVGQMQQSKAASDARKYSAAVAENNATAARQQAAFQESRQREQNERALATQRVRFGKGGVAAAGTVLDVNADRAASGELDALSIRRSGLLQGQSYDNQATLDRFRDEGSMTSAVLGAGSTLLTAGSRANWDKLFQNSKSKQGFSQDPAHHQSTGGFMDSQ